MGGLLIGLIEATFPNQRGMTISIEPIKQAFPEYRLDEMLFGETNGTYIISYDEAAEASLQARCAEAQISLIPLGTVLEVPRLALDDHLIVPLEALYKHWRTTLAFTH